MTFIVLPISSLRSHYLLLHLQMFHIGYGSPNSESIWNPLTNFIKNNQLSGTSLSLMLPEPFCFLHFLQIRSNHIISRELKHAVCPISLPFPSLLNSLVTWGWTQEDSEEIGGPGAQERPPLPLNKVLEGIHLVAHAEFCLNWQLAAFFFHKKQSFLQSMWFTCFRRT